MDTDVCVVIPWRPAPDRLAAYGRVRAFWAHHGFRVIDVDNKGPAFHLGSARNRGVRQANCERVIIADADTIPDIAAVCTALAMSPEFVIYPYTMYHHIPGEYACSADLVSAPITKSYRNSVGGLMITSTATYFALGGMDLRFEARWGFEDSAFHLVASTLGEVRRVEGVVYSFDHAADRDMTEGNPNRVRYGLYQFCSGKPGLMKELIKR